MTNSALMSFTATLDDVRAGLGVSLLGSGLLVAAGISGTFYVRALSARLSLQGLAVGDVAAVT